MGRKRRQAKKQNSPRGQRQSTPPVTHPPHSLWRWRSIPGWIWGTLVFLTLVITILEGVPWLSVDEGTYLDSYNPFSNLFSVTNGGYVPVSNIDAICSPSITFPSGGAISRTSVIFPHFAEYLAHSDRATLPCFMAIAFEHPSGGEITSADLAISITYSLYPLPWNILRRHQTFRFKAVKGPTGQLIWTFLN